MKLFQAATNKVAVTKSVANIWNGENYKKKYSSPDDSGIDLDISISDIELKTDFEINNLLSDDLVAISLNNISITAQLYRLYSEYQRAVDAWYFLYRVSRKKFPVVALNAFSHLLGLNIPSTIKTELLNEAKCLINLQPANVYSESIKKYVQNHLDSDIAPENLTKYYQKFSVQLSRHHLYKFNVQNSASIIEEVKRPFLDNLTYANYLLAIAELRQLADSKFQWNGVVTTAESALFEDTSFLRYIIHHNSWDHYSDQCDVQRLLLETASTASQYFLSKSLPHYAYFHLREELEVSQKLVLPLWTCKLLVLLAWIDINVHRIEDAELKLHSIEVILELKMKDQSIASKHLPPGIPVDDNTDPDRLVLNKNFARIELNSDDSPKLAKQNKNITYSEKGVASVSKNPESLCVFIDLLILRGVLLSFQQVYSLSAIWLDYATKIMSKVEDYKNENKIARDWVFSRKATICFFHATMLEHTRNYTAALKYYNESLERCETGAAQLYSRAVTRSNIQLKQIELEYKMQLLKGNLKPHGSDVNASLAATISNHLKEVTNRNVAKTPPASKIPVSVTPLLKTSTTVKKKQILSPGNFPLAIRGRRLFSSNSDDESSENRISDSPQKSSVLENKENKRATRRLAAHNVKKTVSVNKINTINDSNKKLKLRKADKDIEKIIKSTSEISIYNDTLDNMPSGSTKKPSSERSQSVKKILKTDLSNKTVRTTRSHVRNLNPLNKK